MRDQLLAYLLGDLTPDESAKIEERVASDPAWQEELDRLRACMESSDTDQEEDCPPQDLTNRTCCLVQKATELFQAKDATTLPAALTESQDPSSGSRRWSFADIVIGACILLALGALVLPALQRNRAEARRIACQNNMRELGLAIQQYAQQHGGQLPPMGPRQNAGLFMVNLANTGAITRERLGQLLVCPASELAEEVSSRQITVIVPTHKQIQLAQGIKLQQLQKHMSGSFAIRVGFIDQQGNYRHIKFTNSSEAPMFADAPSYEVPGFLSGNHGGHGQNVSYQDGSVRFRKQCVGSSCNDHLFLNVKDQHAPGYNLQDVVLLRSEAFPLGR